MTDQPVIEPMIDRETIIEMWWRNMVKTVLLLIIGQLDNVKNSNEKIY